MEPSPHALHSFTPPIPNVRRHSQIAAGSSTPDWQKPSARADWNIRRGLSEGDELQSTASAPGRSPADINPGSGETLLGFRRHSAKGEEESQGRVRAATSKAAQNAEDRRRTCSGHQDSPLRRRTFQSLSSGYSSTSRPTYSFTDSTSRCPSFGVSPIFNTSFRPSTTSQSSPQHPIRESLQSRPSHETTLPPWQSDTEVTTCPICGNGFSFWYRKHHCRKCGRVVCANCSPHRITIPRQFIVQPPEDAAPSPELSNGTSVEVIDLTSDNMNDEAPSVLGRSQRSDPGIAPALGGGEEVRLCNPCVPDPNPLPHLPPVTTGQGLRSLLGSDQSPSSRHIRPGSNRLIPDSNQSFLPAQPILGRHISQSRMNGDTNASETSCSRFAPSAASLSTNRRYTHSARPASSSMAHLPLPSVSGSAPDRSDHYVSLPCPTCSNS